MSIIELQIPRFQFGRLFVLYSGVVCDKAKCASKLYIPSSLNTDLLTFTMRKNLPKTLDQLIFCKYTLNLRKFTKYLVNVLKFTKYLVNVPKFTKYLVNS